MTGGTDPHNYISCAAVMVVKDIHRSVDFYRDKLGFQVEQIWGDPPGFAIADTPTASIMLKQGVCPEDADTGVPNGKLISGLWDVYIWIRDMPALLKQLDQRHTPYAAPEETEYGCTEVVVTDPDGYRICFGYCP
ncbi:MAG: VOC family protein [Henriciella sp.]|nr:VOC family protein [Henriciella sp.]